MRQLFLRASALGLMLSCSSGPGGNGGGPASGTSASTSSGASSSGATSSSGVSSGAAPSSGVQSSSGNPSPSGSVSSASGSASGAASSGGGSTSGAAPASGSSSGIAAQSPDGGGAAGTCTNPTHVLPMDPANPQSGITLSGFYVDTDTWNAANYPLTQTMYVCDYDNWYVVANMNNNTHDGAVKTYPDVHKDFPSATQFDSFTAITSSFSHTAPHVGIYEFAYDIWLNGVGSPGSTEVMIWTDNYYQVPSGNSVETVTFDGQIYDVYKSGSYIAFVEKTNVTSGTLNLLSFFQHIVTKGWIAGTSTLGAIDYGVELVSTNGADATFQVNDFSLTTQ